MDVYTYITSYITALPSFWYLASPIYLKDNYPGLGKMSQQLEPLDILTGDMDLVPRIKIMAHNQL